MQNGFTKGLIIGGLIGASVSMAMNPGGMKNKTRRKIMRTGRAMMRKSSNLIADMIDVFR